MPIKATPIPKTENRTLKGMDTIEYESTPGPVETWRHGHDRLHVFAVFPHVFPYAVCLWVCVLSGRARRWERFLLLPFPNCSLLLLWR